MKTITTGNAINYFSERIQKYYGTNPEWENIIDIERVGGEDHDPKFQCTVTYAGKESVWSGYSKKKDVKKKAMLQWLEEHENEVFSATSDTRNGANPKNVTLGEKINTLKTAGIITGYVAEGAMSLVHAAYADYVKSNYTCEEIRNRYGF